MTVQLVVVATNLNLVGQAAKWKVPPQMVSECGRFRHRHCHQEIQPVDPSAQLISVASLLYGLDAQIGDQAREAPAVEDRGPNAVETSMQTDSPRNDVSDGQLEREDRDDSPSI